ncbi:tetratricopeptide repeat protein [Thermodesulfobacteriota bacterium]
MDFSFFKKRLSGPWFALILIGLSVFTIYSNIYNSPFVFDDEPCIVENKNIQNLSSYLSPSKLLKPRAVVDLTFALNYRFGKLNVFGYHLINVWIHIINGFLVYLLVLAILKQPYESDPSNFESAGFSIKTISLFSALIFVVHPIQTQAVTYTVQRYASMSAMFYMGSMLCYIYARTAQLKTAEKVSYKPKVLGLYTLSIVCGMLAFLSKENTATLPGAILLMEYLIVNGTRHSWKKTLPWFALALSCWVLFVLFVSGLFRGELGGANFLEDVSALTKETETVSRWRYLCTQFNVLAIYIRLLFMPVKQSLDYMYPFKTGFWDGLTPLVFMFLVTIAGFGIRSIRRRPVVAFSIFYFFITLSIESSIIPLKDALFEHRLYLPMFGFVLFASYQLFHYLYSKRLLALALSVSIIVSLGTATYLRNKTWKDSITLWSDVVSKNHLNYRAHNNLGAILDKQGRIDEAIRRYYESLRIRPDYETAHYNIGNILIKQGHIEEAIGHYLAALRIEPDYADAHNNLGIALSNQGRLDEAIGHYLEALLINPDYADAHNNLGNALRKQGLTYEAIDHYLEALRIKPEYASAHNNLGVALAQQGFIEEAIRHFKEAVRIKPDYVNAHNNLGVTLTRQGRLDKAIVHYKEVLRVKPDYAEAHNNLGWVLITQVRIEEGITHLREALKIKPDYAQARNNLKKALMIQQQSRELNHMN